MEKEFLNYKEASALKELGFDKPCFGNWQNIEGKPWLSNSKTDNQNQYYGQLCSAPLYQQAFRFFREIYQMDIGIGDIYGDYSKWSFGIHQKDKGMIIPFRDKDIHYKTYEEAELACLKKLIEICQNGKGIR